MAAYSIRMLFVLATAALVALPAPRADAGIRAIARVSVRIMSGGRVALGRSPETSGQPVRRSLIRLEDGSRQTAQLIEFN